LQFEIRLPARKFATYKCVGRAAREEDKDQGSSQEKETTASDTDKPTTDVIEKVA